jgi:nicotinate-nucleotide adenylyltransferase
MRFRTGVFGGTFDPIHNGHLAVAEQCAGLLGLTRVLLIPALQPPHRPPAVASAPDRLAMVELAVAGSPVLAATDVEISRPGPSYTVDTLRLLQAAEPAAQLWLMLGADAAREFAGWHERDEVARLARIAVFNRAGVPSLTVEELMWAGIPADTEMLAVDSPPISASSIRQRLADGLDVSSELPEAVLAHIRAQHLYGA